METKKVTQPAMETAFQHYYSFISHPDVLKPTENDVIKTARYTKQDPPPKPSEPPRNNAAPNDTKSGLSRKKTTRKSILDPKEFKNFLKENPTNKKCKKFITRYHKSGRKNSLIPTKVLQQIQCDGVKKKYDQVANIKELSLMADSQNPNQNNETTNNLQSYSIFDVGTPKSSDMILSEHSLPADIKELKLKTRPKESSKSGVPTNLTPVKIQVFHKTRKKTPKIKNNNENEVFKPRFKKSININSSPFSTFTPSNPQLSTKTMLSGKNLVKPSLDVQRLQEEMKHLPNLKQSFEPVHGDLREQMGSIRHPRHILSEPLITKQNNFTETSLVPVFNVLVVLIAFIASIFLVKFYKKRASLSKKSTSNRKKQGNEIKIETIN